MAQTVAWDAETGMKLKTLNGHTGAVLSAAFSSDDTHCLLLIGQVCAGMGHDVS